MLYRLLADFIVAIHIGYVFYIVVGIGLIIIRCLAQVELDSEPLVSAHTFRCDPDRYCGVNLQDTMRVDGLGIQISLIGGTAGN